MGKSGRVAARLEAEYEYLFTQKLILTPELEINAYNKDDPELRIGSGLSDLELGLRLRYEIRREFAPILESTGRRNLAQVPITHVMTGSIVLIYNWS